MSASPVPEAAIEGSLLFVLGYGRSSASTTPALGAELSKSITEMLQNQGTPELAPEVLKAVRAGRSALEKDPSLSISAQRYERVRSEFLTAHDISSGKGRNVWPVGSTTILKRAGGSWSEALKSVGFAVSSGKRASGFGAARFTPEQFAAAVRGFTEDAAEQGTTTSYQNYVDWRKRQLDAGRTGLPSGPALRNTYGSWSTALRNAGGAA